MKFEEHVKRTEELFGIPGQDIHKWIDGFFDTNSFERLLAGQSPADYDPYSHRKFRHCVEGLEEAYEKFEGKYSREEIKKVFEIINALPSASIFASIEELDEYLAEMQRSAKEDEP